MENRASVLFSDYNYWRARTHHYQKMRQESPFMGFLKATQERLQLFEDMARWCDDQGVNPRLWLYTLFASRKWMFSPKLNQLRSPKHVERFHRMLENDDLTAYRERAQEEEVQAEPFFDPNRDLVAANEAVKSRYAALEDWNKCFEEIRIRLGYHPKSPICKRCPLTEKCIRTLKRRSPFDVLALRNGDITSIQAMRQARERKK